MNFKTYFLKKKKFLEKEESYQYNIQFIVYDNDNTKIYIDLIIKKWIISFHHLL